MRPEVTPTGIGQAGPDRLRVEWKDGHQSLFPVRGLRLACRCASCIEEMTGRPLLRVEDVPEDVRPVRISPVGRYGIQIAWTDGHQTGIYTFEYLRSLDTKGPPQESP
jgi:ATP-binding protein involved in chromosome partitioning